MINMLDKKLVERASRRKAQEAQLRDIQQKLQSNNDTLRDIVDGLSLSLESEKIIFNAFRNNHINGESEKMDDKIDKYLFKQVKEHLIEEGDLI